MRFIRAFAGLLALCLPAAGMAAQAQSDSRWSPIVQSHQGQIFLDRSSLQREGNLRTIFVRAIPAAAYGEMTRAEMSMRFDCARRTFTTLEVRAFKSDGSEMPYRLDSEPQPVGQEADTVALFEGVCAL